MTGQLADKTFRLLIISVTARVTKGNWPFRSSPLSFPWLSDPKGDVLWLCDDNRVPVTVVGT